MTPFVVFGLFVAAFVAGLCDAIGGGGGLITVPALLAAGLPPQLALGTNKGQAVFGAITSAASYVARGAVDRPIAKLAFASGLVGSLVGARVLLLVRPEPLRPIVMALLVMALLLMLARPRPVAVEGGGSIAERRGVLVGALVGMGFYDGFFGPGTGAVLIVVFSRLGATSLVRASGNAKIVNLASNLAAVVVFATRGTVLWHLALPMAIANSGGSYIGARLAVKNGDRLVRAIVVVVVAATVLKLAFDIFR